MHGLASTTCLILGFRGYIDGNISLVTPSVAYVTEKDLFIDTKRNLTLFYCQQVFAEWLAKVPLNTWGLWPLCHSKCPGNKTFALVSALKQDCQHFCPAGHKLSLHWSRGALPWLCPGCKMYLAPPIYVYDEVGNKGTYYLLYDTLMSNNGGHLWKPVAHGHFWVYVLAHWHRLVKNVGWANQNIGEKGGKKW